MITYFGKHCERCGCLLAKDIHGVNECNKILYEEKVIILIFCGITIIGTGLLLCL